MARGQKANFEFNYNERLLTWRPLRMEYLTSYLIHTTEAKHFYFTFSRQARIFLPRRLRVRAWPASTTKIRYIANI